MENWINNLKVGDKVIVGNGAWSKVQTIDKITPTRQVVIGNTRFKNTAAMGEHGYGCTRIYEWTQDAEDEIVRLARRSTILSRLHEVNFDILGDADLEEVNTMILSYVAKNTNVRKGMIVTYTGKKRYYQAEQKKGCEVISHPYIKGKSIFVQLDKIINGVNVNALVVETADE